MRPLGPLRQRNAATLPLAHAAGVLAFYALLFTLFFSPVLFSDRLLAPGDGLIFFLPPFLKGPTLWSAAFFAGYPVAAEPQQQTFYPLARLFAAMGAWNAFVVSAYVLAGSLMYGYVFQVTRSVLSGLVAGVVYSMSGFVVWHLGHTSIVHAAAWVPLQLWALEGMRGPSARAWSAIFSVALALCTLGGHPQVLVYGLGVSTAYALVLGWRDSVNPWRYYTRFIVAVVLGMGLVAVQLVPSIELAAQSNRAEMTYDMFSWAALPPLHLFRFVFPLLFGVGLHRVHGGSYWGEVPFVETVGYLGILPLMLAVVCIQASPSAWRTRFWVVVVLLATLMALGPATPLGEWMYLVPGYNKFRCPGRHLLEITMAVAALAGGGVAALQAVPGAALRYVQRALGILLVVVGGCVGGIALAADRFVTDAARKGVELSLGPADPAIVVPLLTVLLSALILWRFARRTTGRLSAAALLACVIVDLASLGWRAQWRNGAPARHQLTIPAQLAPYRTVTLATQTRIATYENALAPLDAATSNLNWIWDLPSSTGIAGLTLQRHADVMPIAHPQLLDPDNRVFDLLSTRYVLLTNRNLSFAEDWDTLRPPPHWRALVDNEVLKIFENSRALPRAWLVPRLRAMPAAAVQHAIQYSVLPDGTRFDPRQVALVEEPVDLAGSTASAAGDADVVELADARVRVRTVAEHTAFLVLSDVFYPGWQATIDGRPAAIVRTDYLLRGVVVPAGTHEVQFTFWPTSLYLGLAVSILSALFLVGVALGRPRWGLEGLRA